MAHSMPDYMRRGYERRLFIEVFGLTKGQKKRLTPDFMERLMRCKDDAARQILLNGCGDTRGRKYTHYPAQAPQEQLEACKDEEAREVLRAAYRHKKNSGTHVSGDRLQIIELVREAR